MKRYKIKQLPMTPNRYLTIKLTERGILRLCWDVLTYKIKSTKKPKAKRK